MGGGNTVCFGQFYLFIDVVVNMYINVVKIVWNFELFYLVEFIINIAT